MTAASTAWIAAFLAVLGVLHLLLPGPMFRWRTGRDPGDATRSAVRLLGAGLLGLAALALAVSLAL